MSKAEHGSFGWVCGAPGCGLGYNVAYECDTREERKTAADAAKRDVIDWRNFHLDEHPWYAKWYRFKHRKLIAIEEKNNATAA